MNRGRPLPERCPQAWRSCLARGRVRAAGQALVWMTAALPLFIALAGLAIDGAVLLAAHRQLQSVADGAARAGAMRLDVDRLRQSGGADLELDPAAARAAASGYLGERLPIELEWQAQPVAQIQVAARRVDVEVDGWVPTAFMRVVGITSVPVSAHASADLEFGIHSGAGT